MKLVDANVLLYAVYSDAPHHEESRQWLDGALSGESTVAFGWVALLAFIRLSTKAELFPAPLTPGEALERVQDWINAAPAVIVYPTLDQPRILLRLLEQVGVGGNLVNDAHLSALAIEHRCEVVSYDNDFSRFEGVTWERPTVV